MSSFLKFNPLGTLEDAGLQLAYLHGAMAGMAERLDEQSARIAALEENLNAMRRSRDDKKETKT